MTSEINRDLLLDLARLVRRYEPEDWKSLAAAFGDVDFRQAVISILNSLAQLARPRKSPPGGVKRNRTPRLMETVKIQDPEKYRILSDLRARLTSSSLFSSMGELREFASICGLEIRPGLNRTQVVPRLIEYLASLSRTEIEERLSSRGPQRRDFGAEYERWVEIILGKRKGT